MKNYIIILLQYYICNLIQLYFLNFDVFFRIKPWHPRQDALNMSGNQKPSKSKNKKFIFLLKNKENILYLLFDYGYRFLSDFLILRGGGE